MWGNGLVIFTLQSRVFFRSEFIFYILFQPPLHFYQEIHKCLGQKDNFHHAMVEKKERKRIIVLSLYQVLTKYVVMHQCVYIVNMKFVKFHKGNTV